MLGEFESNNFQKFVWMANTRTLKNFFVLDCMGHN